MHRIDCFIYGLLPIPVVPNVLNIVMALAGCIVSTWSDTLLDSVKLVKDTILYLVPLCLVYAIALFSGLLGKPYCVS